MSLLWSIIKPLCVGLAFIAFAVSMTGTRSTIPFLVQNLALGWFGVSLISSIVLFVAALKMLNDDPRTLKSHRYWAWISIAIDVLILGALAMADWPSQLSLPLGIAVIDLIYARWLLNATGLSGVQAYFGEVSDATPGKDGSWDDLA